MDETVEKVYRITRLTCGALFLIPALMSYVIWFMSRDGWAEPAPPLEAVMVGVFVVMGAISLALGPWIRGFSLRQAAAGKFVPQGSGPAAAAMTAAVAGDPRGNRLAGLNTAAVVGCAMGEQTTLFGFVLSFLSQSWPPLLIGGGITVLYMAAMFPRRAVLERWLEQVGIATPGAIPVPEVPAPL